MAATPIPDIDRTLEILSHPRRREIILALRTAPDNILSTHELVNHLYNHEQTNGDIPRSREDLTADLHHLQGPKLAATSFVTYHADANEYEYHSIDRIEGILDMLPLTT